MPKTTTAPPAPPSMFADDAPAAQARPRPARRGPAGAPTPPAAAAASKGSGGALGLIASMAAAAPAKKGRTDKLTVSLPEMEPHIERFIEAQGEIDRWTAIAETERAQIDAAAGPARLEACRRAGKAEASVLINQRMTYTQQNRYSAIPAERMPELEEAFGHSARDYFRQTLKIELTEAAAEDEELLGALIEAIGPEVFARSFKVTRSVKVTEAFHTDYTLKPGVQERAQPFTDDQTIRAARASLKVA